MADIQDPSWSEIDASNDSPPPAGWPEQMQPSDVNNAARAQMGGEKRWYDRNNSTQTTTGTLTAYVLTYASTQAALYDGFETSFVLHATCGAAATLNIDALGSRILRKYDLATTAFIPVAAGDYSVNQVLRVRYNLADDRYDIISVSFWPGAFVTTAGDNAFTGKAIFSKLIIAGGASFLPQGRLTLVTGVAVMTSSQASKTLVYYTPYNGNLVPISDATNVTATVFAELSNDLTASAVNKAGPAAATTDSNYDLFVWNDAGTVRLTRGPLWISSTARGTGAGTTELQMFDGIWTNKVAISNGPGANLGTYVGTIRTDGSSQVNWIPGAIGAGGTAALLSVWNAYNRVEIMGLVGDSTDSWNYNTATIRPADNSTTMRASFVVGLQEDYVQAEYGVTFFNDSVNGGGYVGVGYDSTTAFSGRYSLTNNSSAAGASTMNGIGKTAVQPLGFHYLQALEKGNGAGTQSWFGDNVGTVQNGLTYQGRF